MGTENKANSYTEHSNGGIGIGIRNLKVSTSNNSCNSSAKTNGATDCKNLNESNHKAVSNQQQEQQSVPFVPIYIDEHNVVDGAKEVLKVIRPHWNLNAVEFKIFTDGITNKLVGCFNKPVAISNGIEGSSHNNNNNNNDRKGCTAHGQAKHIDQIPTTTSANSIYTSATNDCDDDNDDSGNLSDMETTASATGGQTIAESATNNVVLVRVYGNKTDLLIDRKAETRNFILLHSYGFAPSLYATFKNGLAYDYVPGVTLNPHNVMQPEIWRLVALRMAEMHRTVKLTKRNNAEDDDKQVPMLWSKTQSFFDLVPERFSDPDKHRRLEGTFLPIERIRAEFDELYKQLETLDSPLVFSHNDLLLGNVIYTESLQKVSFIDYEYADCNFQAFDIGNHFAEFAGVDEVDYTRYPTREFQYEWLRVYLQAYLQQADVSAVQVQRLYVQVNQFALAAHFFWTIWSLIQAEHSTIDFDYVDYAFTRYNEYLAKKQQFLALKFADESS